MFKTLDDARMRRDLLAAELKRLDVDLADRDRRDSTGSRVSGIEWNKWRHDTIKEKLEIEKEIRQIKAWMNEERKRLDIGKVGGNPRDALMFCSKAAEKLLCIMSAGGELDEDERVLAQALRHYIESHAMLDTQIGK